MTAIDRYFDKNTSIAPLAFFRICFGFMLLFGLTRFWANGWIQTLYIDPKVYFPFYGFEFVKPLGLYTYYLFIICALSALCVALGLFYRFASISLFLSFTYIELIDKSTYLNHYYFISLMCFLLMFLPANRYFSLDVWRNKSREIRWIPSWHIDSLKLMMGILYVYAGLAKINSDWLLEALPLKIWLPARNDLFLIGPLFNLSAIPYLFSWFGCLYDLSIPFLLLNQKTRPYAYLAVIIFHLLTAILFPIGMFPHIMMVAALIFFPASFHQKIINFIQKLLGRTKNTNDLETALIGSKRIKMLFALFFALQLILPFRYLTYPGELFWTEEGYRFSWRVMLMEKAGYAQFTIKDQNGKYQVVNNNDFLSPLQEKMMATQPDMILQYAHILRDYYARMGYQNPQVYCDSYVALNGRLGKPLLDPTINLSEQTESLRHKTWINKFEDEITGF